MGFADSQLKLLRRENSGFIGRLAPTFTPRTCQWIKSEPSKTELRQYGADQFKCGAPCQSGSSYCPEHHAICYLPLTARQIAPIAFPELAGPTGEQFVEGDPMAKPSNILTSGGKSASGKPSGGYQGQGRAAKATHMTTNPSKPKPSVQLAGEDGGYGGGSSAGRIANARGGEMNHPRNNEGYGKKSG